MNKRKYQIRIALLLVFLVAINTYVLTRHKEGTTTLDKDTLIVGMELKFPPFETVDANGNPMGVSVELAQKLGEKLGKHIEIRSLDWAGLIPALQTQNIDLIISSMSITEERLETIDFSEEYASSDIALAIYKGSDVNSYEDLNRSDVTVAVKQGTIGEMWAMNNLPDAKIKSFTEVSAGLLDVNGGQSTAFIYDPLSLIESSKNLSQIKLNLDPLPGTKGWGVGMRKGETALQQAINQALMEIKEEGFYDKMREKYLKEDVEKYESYGLKYFF
ncbi:transporter substrate-binding domain-containing protein [Niameybacter massiliensis]|uniref:transporter substrate-binding domain-containing protein n=1 Tax=Niameybacter massiliensis TaxID=1658108 RepID=UPI0006B518E9|nr:transporter substrate-binding domain-containing protein [Niameybacter massiliensis]